MNPLEVAAGLIVIGIICFLFPLSFVIVLGIIGVMLADTQLVPPEFIYWARFVPIGILCLRVFFNTVIPRSQGTLKSTMVKVWLPFLALAFLSVSYSEEPQITLQRSLSFLFVVVGFGWGLPSVAIEARRLRQLLLMITVIMAGSVVFSFYASSGVLVVASDVEYERLRGVFTNPNTLGFIAMETVFIIVYLWRSERHKFKRIVFFIGMLAVGSAIFSSGSRASVLGFLVGLLVFLILDSRIRKTTLPTFLVVFFCLAICFVVLSTFFPHVTGSLLRTGSSGRELLFRRDLELAAQHPYLGVGYGGSDNIFLRSIMEMRWGTTYGGGSHNSFTKLLVETGIVGVVLACGAFFILLRRAFKMLPSFRDPQLGVAVLSGVAGCLVNSFFESWLFGFGSSATIPFWLFLAILSQQTDQSQAVRRGGTPA